MHEQEYYVMLLVLSHLHLANPTFEIWQNQKTSVFFQMNARKLVFLLGLLKRLSVEFENLNIDSNLVVLGRKKVKEIYQNNVKN